MTAENMSDEELEGPQGSGSEGEDEGSDAEMPGMGESSSSSLPEGVEKEILKKGDGWKKAKTGDEVHVHYVGTLKSDGSEFDSSRGRGTPFTFTLGKGQVIKGWDVGVASMLKGETAKFTLEPAFAYGEAGSPPKIPANATLVFEVELLSWVSKDDLFGDEGVIKSVAEEGVQQYKRPKKESEVLLVMKATAEDGAVIEDKIDIDYQMGSQLFGPLGRIVDKALEGMSQGETCSLACAKDYVLFKDDKQRGVVTIELHLKEIYSVSDVSYAKDKSIMKKTIREGEGYEKPQDGSMVTLKVEAATDAAGGALQGFSGPSELKFEACLGEVCDVIERAITDMKKGERALVTCTAAAAPKAAEAKLGLSSIKAETVILTLELLDMTKVKDSWNMSDEDKVGLALKRKEHGGKLFSAKRYELALDKYKKVEDAIASHDSCAEDLKIKAIDVKKLAELNKAACFLKVGDPAGAIESCDKVLKDDKSNIKALFRRGRARYDKRDHLDALQDLERVLELDPNNAEVKVLLQHVRRAQKLVDRQAKATFAKMCKGLGKLGAASRTKAAAVEKKSDEDEFDGSDEELEKTEDSKANGGTADTGESKAEESKIEGGKVADSGTADTGESKAEESKIEGGKVADSGKVPE